MPIKKLKNKDFDNIEVRQAIWISRKLPSITSRLGPIQHIDDVKEAIDKFELENDLNRSTIDYLRQQSRTSLISADYFAWILEGDEARILRWLKRRYIPRYIPKYGSDDGFPRIESNCPTSSIYNTFIQSFDVWSALCAAKVDEINSCKRDWAHHILLDKRYKWIDAKNEDQVLWAWQYIQLGQHTKFKNQSIQHYYPINTKEYYESVLSVFDCWMGHPSEMKLSLDEMKKAWAQQKYRKGLNGKKQCTFVLHEDTKKKLDHMATQKDLKLNEMLEKLINAEYLQMFPKKT